MTTEQSSERDLAAQQLEILNLVAAGKLSVTEANQLLVSLEAQAQDAGVRATQKLGAPSPGPEPGATTMLPPDPFATVQAPAEPSRPFAPPPAPKPPEAKGPEPFSTGDDSDDASEPEMDEPFSSDEEPFGERSYRGADLRGADMHGRDLQGADLRGANLQGVDLQGANLRRAVLVRANLKDADLRGAILERTNLQAAVLTGAKLNGAMMVRVNAQLARLNSTDMSEANLERANLQAADLRGAILTGARLSRISAQAARLDGLSGVGLFRHITVPSIRPALVVVLTTIAMATLKVFDIVRTMTGGNFGTSVVANEFYTQSFRYNDKGIGATLAVILFVLVIPLVVYNVRQMRKVEEIR